MLDSLRVAVQTHQPTNNNIYIMASTGLPEPAKTAEPEYEAMVTGLSRPMRKPPKKPMTAYNIFYKDERKRILKQRRKQREAIKDAQVGDAPRASSIPMAAAYAAQDDEEKQHGAHRVSDSSTVSTSSWVSSEASKASREDDDEDDEDGPPKSTPSKSTRSLPEMSKGMAVLVEHQSSFRDMGREIAKRWKEIGIGELDRYQRLAERDAQRYKREIKVFESEQRQKVAAEEAWAKGQDGYCSASPSADDSNSPPYSTERSSDNSADDPAVPARTTSTNPSTGTGIPDTGAGQIELIRQLLDNQRNILLAQTATVNQQARVPPQSSIYPQSYYLLHQPQPSSAPLPSPTTLATLAASLLLNAVAKGSSSGSDSVSSSGSYSGGICNNGPLHSYQYNNQVQPTYVAQQHPNLNTQQTLRIHNPCDAQPLQQLLGLLIQLQQQQQQQQQQQRQQMSQPGFNIGSAINNNSIMQTSLSASSSTSSSPSTSADQTVRFLLEQNLQLQQEAQRLLHNMDANKDGRTVESTPQPRSPSSLSCRFDERTSSIESSDDPEPMATATKHSLASSKKSSNSNCRRKRKKRAKANVAKRSYSDIEYEHAEILKKLKSTVVEKQGDDDNNNGPE